MKLVNRQPTLTILIHIYSEVYKTQLYLCIKKSENMKLTITPWTSSKQTVKEVTFFRFSGNSFIRNISFLQGWNPSLFSEGIPPPLSGYPLFLKQIIKNYPPLSESHPNWCMQIAWNTLKWRTYISYYTKSIEDIVIITLYRFWLNSVFTADSLVTYFLWCFSYLIC